MKRMAFLVTTIIIVIFGSLYLYTHIPSKDNVVQQEHRTSVVITIDRNDIIDGNLILAWTIKNYSSFPVSFDDNCAAILTINGALIEYPTPKLELEPGDSFQFRHIVEQIDEFEQTEVNIRANSEQHVTASTALIF